MAMNTKLSEGTILLYYPEIEERAQWRPRAFSPIVNDYVLSIKAIKVYSRKARTNGSIVPIALKPYLESLKIKLLPCYAEGHIRAIGCEVTTLYNETVRNDFMITDSFIEAFKNIKTTTIQSDTFFENDFIDKFLDTKTSNSSKKQLLFPTRESYGGYVEIKDMVEFEPSELWAKSRHNKSDELTHVHVNVSL